MSLHAHTNKLTSAGYQSDRLIDSSINLEVSNKLYKGRKVRLCQASILKGYQIVTELLVALLHSGINYYINVHVCILHVCICKF